MASLVSRSPSSGGEGIGEGTKKGGRLPELSPVREEDGSPSPSPSQGHLSLPPVASSGQHAISTESLMEALGLAGADEASLGSLLSSIRGKVMSALGELQAITTHDDNLERQYRETVAENTELLSALEKARREVRHLRGQLSILQMTSSEIREERARRQLRERKRAEHEREVQSQRSRSQYADDPIPVLTVAERSRTVNARGQYVDHRHSVKKGLHSRRSTYPQPLTRQGPKAEPLPPPLSGCDCSVCHARQSLGALTLGREQQVPGQQTKSGQQILLGDRVIIKGEKPGTVRYIGRLDFDILDLVYIGIHLDLPVGVCDGSLKGRRYFQCPPNHGVFVRPSAVVCVTGRKPHSGGTIVPRIREKIPTGFEISRSASRTSKSHTPLEDARRSGHAHTVSPSPHSSRATPTMLRARNTVEAELALLKHRDPNELVNESVVQMSERMKALSLKSKRQTQPRPMEVEPDKRDTPTEPHPPPRPQAPEPPSPLSTPSPPSPLPPPPERTPTPLSASLLRALTGKDLGTTGFVTATELAATLMQLEGGRALTGAEVERLFAELGVDTSEGVGIPYQQALPQLTHAIEQLWEHKT